MEPNRDLDPTNPDDHSAGPTVDLQVVGGGLAGLLAVNLAADAGRTARLIERRPEPGGRAVTTAHHGHRLNLGPHALYRGGALRRALLDLGIDPPATAPRLKGATGSLAGGRIGLLPGGPVSLLRSRLLSPGAKVRLARYLAGLPKIDPTTLAGDTVDDLLDRVTAGHPDLRKVLWGLVNLTTYDSASDVAGADAAVAQLQLGLDEGVVYVDGGWGSIVAALRDRAESAGVDLVTAEARRVEGTDVVTADGHRLRAGTVVVAAGSPAVTDRLLGLADDHHYRRAAGPPVEASVLDLGLSTPPPVGAHLGLDRGLYATLHSVAAGLAPTGGHLVSVARYRRPGDDMGVEATRALLLDHAGEMGIDPAAIVMDRYLHELPVTWGRPLAERGGLAGRPPVEVPDRPGVFVAGDWIGPEGLLADAAAASARAAVVAALRSRPASSAGAFSGRAGAASTRMVG